MLNNEWSHFVNMDSPVEKMSKSKTESFVSIFKKAIVDLFTDKKTLGCLTVRKRGKGFLLEVRKISAGHSKLQKCQPISSLFKCGLPEAVRSFTIQIHEIQKRWMYKKLYLLYSGKYIDRSMRVGVRECVHGPVCMCVCVFEGQYLNRFPSKIKLWDVLNTHTHTHTHNGHVCVCVCTVHVYTVDLYSHGSSSITHRGSHTHKSLEAWTFEAERNATQCAQCTDPPVHRSCSWWSGSFRLWE